MVRVLLARHGIGHARHLLGKNLSQGVCRVRFDEGVCVGLHHTDIRGVTENGYLTHLLEKSKDI